MDHDHDRMFHHHNAHQLDSEERRAWLPPGEVLDALEIAAGMHVADIGAGTGYFAIPMAERVTSRGRIYAVDIQPEMLALLEQKLPPSSPVELIRGSAEATGLPDLSQNIVLLANVWHEIDDRAKALAEAERVLSWGGRLSIVDWRTDHTPPPGPPAEHRLAGTTVVDELRKAGWRGVTLRNVGSYAYLMTAMKPVRCCS